MANGICGNLLTPAGITAVVALAQPWVYAIWRRLGGSRGIVIAETGDIELGFSLFGPTLSLRGSLYLDSGETLVAEMKAKVTRLQDDKAHVFSWGLCRPSQTPLAVRGDSRAELPSGFLLRGGNIHRYYIEFHDQDVLDVLRLLLVELREDWTSFANEKLRGSIAAEHVGSNVFQDRDLSTAAVEAVYNMFCASEGLREKYRRIDELCFWKDGEYLLNLEVHSAPCKAVHAKSWSFSLSKQQAERLKLNTILIVSEVCRQMPSPYFVAYSRYASAK